MASTIVTALACVFVDWDPLVLTILVGVGEIWRFVGMQYIQELYIIRLIVDNDGIDLWGGFGTLWLQIKGLGAF